MIYAIACRELRSLFFSPMAWYLIGTLQLILAWLFLVQLEGFQEIQPQLIKHASALGVMDLVVVPLLDSAALILLLITPLLSMRLLSEEYRSGTIQLLFSAPISMGQIVLGKYLALLCLFGICLLMIALMPISLMLGGGLDLTRLAASLLGLALLLATLAAIGLFISSLTSQPGVAAIGSYGLLLFLWVIDLTAGVNDSPLFNWLSLASHFRQMLNGLVSSSDLIYYLLMTITALTLTVHRLNSRRTLA